MYTEFFDWLYPVFGGPAGARLVHRIFAVVFILIPIYQLIFDPKSIIHWLKQCFTWHDRDIKMLIGISEGIFYRSCESSETRFL